MTVKPGILLAIVAAACGGCAAAGGGGDLLRGLEMARGLRGTPDPHTKIRHNRNLLILTSRYTEATYEHLPGPDLIRGCIRVIDKDWEYVKVNVVIDVADGFNLRELYVIRERARKGFQVFVEQYRDGASELLRFGDSPRDDRFTIQTYERNAHGLYVPVDDARYEAIRKSGDFHGGP